jgi:hypothetical protein
MGIAGEDDLVQSLDLHLVDMRPAEDVMPSAE